MPIRRLRELRVRDGCGGPARARALLPRDVTPVSDRWGDDRGTPIDRAYIAVFLAEHDDDIRGNVVEIGDARYTKQFGTVVHTSDVLDVRATNSRVTLVGDLTHDDLPEARFDCVIATQVLHQIYDVAAAVRSLHRLLRPGGTLLATVPGITRLAGEPGWTDAETGYWSLTSASARRLFATCFRPEATEIRSFGNVLTASAFLYGLAAEELDPSELCFRDPRFEVVVAVCAVKGA